VPHSNLRGDPTHLRAGPQAVGSRVSLKFKTLHTRAEDWAASLLVSLEQGGGMALTCSIWAFELPVATSPRP
jgi:hypothetical protein